MEIISTLSFIVIPTLWSASGGARGACHRWALGYGKQWTEMDETSEAKVRGEKERTRGRPVGAGVCSQREVGAVVWDERCKGCVIPASLNPLQTRTALPHSLNRSLITVVNKIIFLCSTLCFYSAVTTKRPQSCFFIHLQKGISVSES